MDSIKGRFSVGQKVKFVGPVRLAAHGEYKIVEPLEGEVCLEHEGRWVYQIENNEGQGAYVFADDLVPVTEKRNVGVYGSY